MYIHFAAIRYVTYSLLQTVFYVIWFILFILFLIAVYHRKGTSIVHRGNYKLLCHVPFLYCGSTIILRTSQTSDVCNRTLTKYYTFPVTYTPRECNTKTNKKNIHVHSTLFFCLYYTQLTTHRRKDIWYGTIIHVNVLYIGYKTYVHATCAVSQFIFCKKALCSYHYVAVIYINVLHA
jgi:hypothetical protein